MTFLAIDFCRLVDLIAMLTLLTISRHRKTQTILQRLLAVERKSWPQLYHPLQHQLDKGRKTSKPKCIFTIITTNRYRKRPEWEPMHGWLSSNCTSVSSNKINRRQVTEFTTEIGSWPSPLTEAQPAVKDHAITYTYIYPSGRHRTHEGDEV